MAPSVTKRARKAVGAVDQQPDVDMPPPTPTAEVDTECVTAVAASASAQSTITTPVLDSSSRGAARADSHKRSFASTSTATATATATATTARLPPTSLFAEDCDAHVGSAPTTSVSVPSKDLLRALCVVIPQFALTVPCRGITDTTVLQSDSDGKYRTCLCLHFAFQWV